MGKGASAHRWSLWFYISGCRLILNSPLSVTPFHSSGSESLSKLGCQNHRRRRRRLWPFCFSVSSLPLTGLHNFLKMFVRLRVPRTTLMLNTFLSSHCPFRSIDKLLPDRDKELRFGCVLLVVMLLLKGNRLAPWWSSYVCKCWSALHSDSDDVQII